MVQRRDQQVRRVVPAAEQRPPGVVLRSEDEAVHADRHVLLDAPPAVRQRRQRDGVLQRAASVRSSAGSTRRCTTRRRTSRRPCGWCGQVLDTNGDGKITQAVERPGRSRQFGAVPGRHDRQAAAARGTRSAAPFDPKLDTMVSYSLYAVIPSPVDDTRLGRQRAVSRLPGAAAARQQSAVDAARRRSSRCRSRASIRAASTSTATASSGRRWRPAATWPASTCASART